MTSESTKQQIGGTHYVNMGMQPFHFAMVNGWDAGAFSILKYISRHRSKNGVEDLKKARHFVDLRRAEIGHAVKGFDFISIGVYISANKLSGADATALVQLREWVFYQDEEMRTALLDTIDLLISEYPTPLLR